MKTRLILFFLILVALNGCLPTLHPLYHLKDLIYLPNLYGTWTETESKTSKSMIWNIMEVDEDSTKDEFKLLRIQMIKDKDTLDYAAGVLRLGSNYYLDLYLPAFATDAPLFDQHMYPVHTIWKLGIYPDSLTISSFNSDWLRGLINDNLIRIKHEKTEKGVLITANTDELQQFVTKYGADERAFKDTKVFVR
ncbi:hypothetical protein EP331_05060 [bacterium]|nr:MAG: hypothetical protein EP331_05060 [bacterium]